MKAGDYVRTKKGTFDRFITSHTQDNLTWYTFQDRGNITNPENYVIKSSPNIIDLIEVGDYVNGEKIIEISKSGKVLFYWDYDRHRSIENGSIKSIVTKESFESMEYRL